MKVKRVCDLCQYGDNNHHCYKSGVTKCYALNGYYKDFELKKELRKEELLKDD